MMRFVPTRRDMALALIVTAVGCASSPISSPIPVELAGWSPASHANYGAWAIDVHASSGAFLVVNSSSETKTTILVDADDALQLFRMHLRTALAESNEMPGSCGGMLRLKVNSFEIAHFRSAMGLGHWSAVVAVSGNAYVSVGQAGGAAILASINGDSASRSDTFTFSSDRETIAGVYGEAIARAIEDASREFVVRSDVRLLIAEACRQSP